MRRAPGGPATGRPRHAYCCPFGLSGSSGVTGGVVTEVLGGLVVGDWVAGRLGVAGAEVVGGADVGFCVVGDDDGELLGDRVRLGVTLGWTAAPWVVSRSNLLTSPIAWKVYAAQICAG